MKPCRKCENQDWKFEITDGWVNATCRQCGNSFSFEKKKKTPVDESTPCRKCGSRVELRQSRLTEKKKKKPYYFTATYHCTNRSCRTLYLSEAHKVYNQKAMDDNIQENLKVGKEASKLKSLTELLALHQSFFGVLNLIEDRKSKEADDALMEVLKHFERFIFRFIGISEERILREGRDMDDVYESLIWGDTPEEKAKHLLAAVTIQP